MSTGQPRADLIVLLMRAASALAERINATVVDDEHPYLRPAHGLVFLRISGSGATAGEIAGFLGITKQSAAAIVEQLEAGGLVSREPHPTDRRARVVHLTGSGRELTRRATRAALAEWAGAEAELGAATMHSLAGALQVLGRDGSPRPVW